jgi:arylsulfatase A-like enzyme
MAAILVAQVAHAQTDKAGGTPTVLPRPDFHFPGNVGRTFQDSDKAQFPQPVQAPKGAPNVVLILIDDAGFGQFSTFGGGVPSPTMDALAAEGLRFNRFHTTALCSPTRAALLTGRNHHSVSSGVIQEAATGYDGYTGIIPRNAGTIGEILRQNGYMTAWIGKNHNTPTWEASAAGPFDHWANGLGFDYFYGFNGGDMNHWNPVLYENRNLVPASSDNGASMEGTLSGCFNEIATLEGAPEDPAFLLQHIDELGGPKASNHIPVGWAWAVNAPFQWGKQVASHLGGTRNPLVIAWPDRIKDAGGIRTQFHHAIDISPTILEAAHLPQPTEVNGVKQKPIEGVSMMYSFDDPRAAGTRHIQYFEMLGNRALYRDGWIATAPSRPAPLADHGRFDRAIRPGQVGALQPGRRFQRGERRLGPVPAEIEGTSG